MFYEFEKAFLTKINSWNPVTVDKTKIAIQQYGENNQSEGLRLVIGFFYNTNDGGDRASLGNKDYEQRIETTVLMDLFAGKEIPRKTLLELFKELSDYCHNNLKAYKFDFQLIIMLKH